MPIVKMVQGRQVIQNFPKYQPCPKCGAGSKRVTVLGNSGQPVYHCHNHLGFVVRV